MVILVSLRLLLKSKIKRKPLVLVLMELMLIDVCLLDFVKKLWRYSWTISLSMELLLIIVLGHKISERGIEVDRAKVEAIEKMPCPRDVKGIRSILGHAGFYKRFIKDFSKISKPLNNLLQKDVPFF
jgi:hypothetical protein